jgi:hypothetical protein
MIELPQVYEAVLAAVHEAPALPPALEESLRQLFEFIVSEQRQLRQAEYQLPLVTDEELHELLKEQNS